MMRFMPKTKEEVIKSRDAIATPNMQIEYRIFDLKILIQSADQIFDLKIL